MFDKNVAQQRADQLNILAAKGEPLPDKLSAPEQQLYISMRYLYLEYRKQHLTKDEAIKEKQMIFKAYIDNAFNYQLYLRQAEIQKVFASHYQEIKNSGCEVCKKLDKILCGLDEEVRQ